MPTTTINLTGQALSKVDDTNVTLTLGGTPLTALLKATSITVGWSGTLADARIASAATWNAKESALTFSTGLTRTVNTITIDSSVVTLTGAQALSNKTGNISQWTNDSGYLTSLAGAVTSVTGSGNIASSGGATPNITFTGTLPIANGGTALSTLGTASQQIRVNAGATALEYFTPASSGLTIGGTAISGGADRRILFQDATASDFVTQTANFTMGSVASGYLDVPTGYALGGSKLIKYNESGIGGLSFGIGADPTGGGFYYHNLAIGINAVAAAGNNGIAIGYGSTTTAGGQLVIGSSGDPMSSVYIGSGVTAASPSSITYNATGGSGTNIAGAALTIAGGKGTGSGAPGTWRVQTSTTLASGITLQSLVTRLTISGGAVTTDASTATWADKLDFVFSTGTGTKIGTATTQKIGFWNATPIVQPTTAVAAAVVVSGAGGNIKHDDTFDGYTVEQVVRALRNLGILA